VADLKAVSQDLMQSSLKVTDSIYSVLSSGQSVGRTDLRRQDYMSSQCLDTLAPAKRGEKWAHLDSNQGPTEGGR